MSKTLAILSPTQNAYSETFIQAHRNLPFNIKFYYNGYLPTALEGKSMLELPWTLRIRKKLLKGFSANEKKLIFSLQNEKVDVVLAEYGPTAAESLQIVKYLNLPLLVHFHGYDASVTDLLKVYKEKYRQVFAYASAVIVVSKKMRDDVLALGCPEGKIVMNAYGPRQSFFEVVPEFNSDQFLSIGRFVEKKAPYLTILSFKNVLERFPEAKLKMIGDGMLLGICKEIVSHFNLESRIKFLGIQDIAGIQKEMQQSIAFVQHSVTAANGDSEGTPVAVLEAQAAGLPVISTYHAGIPDVVIQNETGLLCDERDVETMSNNMIRILSDKEFAMKLGRAGRGRVFKNFTMEKHLQILTRVIQEAFGFKPYT